MSVDFEALLFDTIKKYNNRLTYEQILKEENIRIILP